jgi:hypothetical protein
LEKAMKKEIMFPAIIALFLTPLLMLAGKPIVDDLSDISNLTETAFTPLAHTITNNSSYGYWMVWGLVAACAISVYKYDHEIKETVEKWAQKIKKTFRRVKARACPCVATEQWCFCQSKSGECRCIVEHGVCRCIMRE